jgi:Family of unknown function (DUF6404)
MRPTKQEAMSFLRKRDAALAILAESGISKSSYRPPLLRIIWWMGIEIPPFPFAKLGTVIFYQAGSFCLIFGLFTYFLMPVLIPSMRHDTIALILLRSLIAGSFYTLLILFYYMYIRRKYKLPKWSDL